MEPAKKKRQPYAKFTPRRKFQLKAARKVNYAVKTGKLVRMPCEVCGDEPTDGHHDDYNKPLQVRWLCKKHHLEHHNANRPEKKPKPKPPVRLLQAQGWANSREGKAVLKEALIGILAKEAELYGKWQKMSKDGLAATRINQVRRVFDKRISALKTIIQCVSR